MKSRNRRHLMTLLNEDRAVRDLLARAARTEVKDYLQEISEESGMAFVSPAGFLRGIREAGLSASAVITAEEESSAPDPAPGPGRAELPVRQQRSRAAGKVAPGDAQDLGS